jgi:uncharacterized membrane protein YeaQ/YmgE (transglycosylase-associated protein family)
MYIVWMLVVGLVVGVVAKLFVPGRDGGGIFTTMLLGIAGSLVAGLIGHALGWYHGVWTGAGFIASVGGAMLLLLLYRLVGSSRFGNSWRS